MVCALFVLVMVIIPLLGLLLFDYVKLSGAKERNLKK